jgi:antitoxin component YwqK of YwqJK toxin-antitoxin module
MDTPPPVPVPVPVPVPGPGIDENQKVNLTLKKGEYIGYVKNGVPDGNGVITYKNGNVWEGTWVNGKREGKGKMKYSDGNSIEGEWKDDNIDNGTGTMLYTKGTTFTIFN